MQMPTQSMPLAIVAALPNHVGVHLSERLFPAAMPQGLDHVADTHIGNEMIRQGCCYGIVGYSGSVLTFTL